MNDAFESPHQRTVRPRFHRAVIVSTLLAAISFLVWYGNHARTRPVTGAVQPSLVEDLQLQVPRDASDGALQTRSTVDVSLRVELRESSATPAELTLSSSERVQLSGRAVDEHGNAIGRTQIHARLRTGSSRVEFWSGRAEILQADEHGRFEWTLAKGAEPAGRTAWFLKTGREDVFAESVLPFIVPKHHDLGDVRFEPPPVLVTGRVVDVAGNAVAEATLLVQSVTWVQGERNLRHIASHRATSDSAGAFEVRGFAPEGELAVNVGAHEHLPAVQEFLAGERDVVVVLTDAAQVKGRLLLDEDIDPVDLSVIVVTPDKSYSWAADLDGSFQIQGIPLGPALLALGGRRWGGPPMELFELEIARGAAQDSRLDPIDLRGVLLRTRLRVEDADGVVVGTIVVRALTQTSFHVPDDSLTLPLVSKSGSDGFHTILHGAPVLIELLADGLRANPCTLAGGEMRLTLQRGLQVEVRLSGTEQLPKDAFAGVQLHLPPGLQRPRDRSSGPASDANHFALPHAGEWKGWVTLARGAAPGCGLGAGQEFRIEVQDIDDVQRFEIRLDSTSIERAAELGRSRNGR